MTAQDERAAVVAWLRRTRPTMRGELPLWRYIMGRIRIVWLAAFNLPLHCHVQYSAIAEAIERGDHITPGGE